MAKEAPVRGIITRITNITPRPHAPPDQQSTVIYTEQPPNQHAKMHQLSCHPDTIRMVLWGLLSRQQIFFFDCTTTFLTIDFFVQTYSTIGHGNRNHSF